MNSILGVILKTICFSPRSPVSSVATASVFHCVYNEQKQRETEKEAGRKEGKTERKIGGEKQEA